MTTQNLLLSICIPTYNRSAKLSQAIESVLNQTYTKYELIICDNASTDNTRQIVASYCDSRIKYFYYDNLVSMYANHNRCLKHSQGQWIAFLHSDDLLTNLENLVKIIHNLPSSTSCCFPLSLNNSMCRNWTYLEVLSFLNGHSPSGSLYRLDVLKKIQGFKEDNIIADWEVLLDFLYAGEEIVNYDPNQTSFIKRIQDGQNSYLKSIKDGTAHQGKTYCVKRQFIKLNQKKQVKPLLEEIVRSWDQSQIMKLNFYLYLGGFVSDADTLAKLAYQNGKYSYFHLQHFYSLLAKYLQLDKFIPLYKKIRLIYH